jgi:hypothetical protein
MAQVVHDPKPSIEPAPYVVTWCASAGIDEYDTREGC